MNCCEKLIRALDRAPDNFAVSTEYDEITYTDLNMRSNMFANWLLAHGIGQGDRLVLVTGNCTEAAIVIIACFKLGITVLAMNHRWTREHIRGLVGKYRGKVVVHENDSFSNTEPTPVNKSKPLYVSLLNGEVGESRVKLGSLLTQGNDSPVFCSSNDDSCAYVIFTSGSTAEPKAVPRSYRQLWQFVNLYSQTDRVDLVALTFLPLFHLAGLGYFIRCLFVGGTYVTMRNFSIETTVSLMRKKRPSSIYLIPPLAYGQLCDVISAEDGSCVEIVELGGGNISASVIKKIFSKMPNARLYTKYGQSETWLATSAFLSAEDIKKSPRLLSSVGRCAPGTELKIIRQDGTEVEIGEVGELCVKSPLVLAEYLDGNFSLEKIIDKDGWCHTQDLLCADEQGYMFFRGRERDMIKTGGENVYAQEVEAVLLEHPLVDDAAVFGVPDEKYGEAIAAALVINSSGRLDTAELIDFFKARCASYKKPRYIALMDKLPQNETGKTQKKELIKNWEKICKKI